MRRVIVSNRDTRTRKVYAYNVSWKSKLRLLSLIAVVKNNIYQQKNDNDICKMKFLKY
jgi:hypothetical protein